MLDGDAAGADFGVAMVNSDDPGVDAVATGVDVGAAAGTADAVAVVAGAVASMASPDVLATGVSVPP
jgi:hypothetical protein